MCKPDWKDILVAWVDLTSHLYPFAFLTFSPFLSSFPFVRISVARPLFLFSPRRFSQPYSGQSNRVPVTVYRPLSTGLDATVSFRSLSFFPLTLFLKWNRVVRQWPTQTRFVFSVSCSVERYLFSFTRPSFQNSFRLFWFGCSDYFRFFQINEIKIIYKKKKFVSGIEELALCVWNRESSAVDERGIIDVRSDD